MVCPNKPHALHEGPLVKRKWLLWWSMTDDDHWWLFTHSFEFLFLPHRAHSSHNVAATSPISIPCKVFVPHLKRKTRHQTVSMMISEKLPFLDSLQMSVISQNHEASDVHFMINLESPSAPWCLSHPTCRAFSDIKFSLKFSNKATWCMLWTCVVYTYKP